MIVDCCYYGLKLNPNPEDFHVSYDFEPNDGSFKDVVLLLLHNLLTFQISPKGKFLTSINDFFILKKSLVNVKDLVINLTPTALQRFKDYLGRRALIEDIKGGVSNDSVATTLKTNPYKDQASAINFLLFREKGLNCCSVGIGKTFTAIGTYNMLKNQGKVCKGLVITLNQIKTEWGLELKKHSNYKFKVIRNGTNKVLDDISDFKKQDFLVCHYDAISNDLVKAALIDLGFNFWIVDEAHVLRNIESERSKAVYEMFKTTNPKYMVFLTGTPVTSSPNNAFALLRFLADEISLTSKTKFENHFCNFIMIPRKKGSRQKIPILNKKNPHKNLDQLKYVMDMYTFRKTHQDVEGFPETQYSPREIVLGDEQMKLYKHLEDETYSQIALMPDKAINLQMVLVKTLRQRQALSHPSILGEYKTPSAKFEMLDLLLEEILEDKESKVVVFSCFRDTLDLLTQKYKKQYGATIFAGATGGLTFEGREENVEKFLSDPDCRVLNAMTSLGVGKNWGHVARTGIFIDLPLIPIDFKQSVGRITRRGAKGTSSIIILKAANTVDDWVWNLHERSRDMSSQVIGQDEKIILDKDELLKTLKGINDGK